MNGIIIEPTAAVFPPAYISSSSRLMVKFTNTTNENIVLRFKKYPTKEEEESDVSLVDIYDPKQRGTFKNVSVFSTDQFSFECDEIVVWPKTFQQTVVTFVPTIATKYEATAYISMNDNSQRFPFKLSGSGLPPVAHFVTDNILVGHIALDTIFDYVVELQNTGNVIVEYSLEERSSKPLQFIFSPKSGLIPIGQSTKISVKFIASGVGAFTETFTFKVKGATQNHPTITFSGKIIGPVFTVSPKQIDFGTVGYGFLYSQKLTIENKSEIPFDYNIRMSHDGSFERREFNIEPLSGTVSKFGQSSINVDFIPTTVRVYDLIVYIDIARFGDKVASIPISAHCVSPNLSLYPEIVDFGDIFIGHEYTQPLQLRNMTDFVAKYEFVEQNEASKKMGNVSLIQLSGIVEAHQQNQVMISLKGKTLGKISIECFFQIYGSDDPPLKLNVIGNCVGPTIEFSMSSISFASVQVLKKESKQLLIKNTSLIPAKFKGVIDQTIPVFTMDPIEGLINPQESFPLSVQTSLNDILSFTGKLKIFFDYLSPFSIPISANGIGSPIVSSVDMTSFDFGHILTQQASKKVFSLTNHSDRSYEIRWTLGKIKVPKDLATDIVCKISPEYAILDPRESHEFEVYVFSSNVVSFSMNVQCHSTVKRQRSEMYNFVVKGTFVQPLITISPPSLDFSLTSKPSEDDNDSLSINSLRMIIQQLVFSNTTMLPLTLELDCPEPFYIQRNTVTVEPKQSTQLDVSFNPAFKDDYNTETINKKMVVSFSNHPQKMIINMKALITIPNIKFEPQEDIDFGVMMVNTEQSKTISMINQFGESIKYHWSLQSENEESTKVFDVFPLRGEILPNESIVAHFNYFALEDPNGKTASYSSIAICHVFGGPDYTFKLSGKAASINYRIDPTHIESSGVDFSLPTEHSLNIENNSSVPIHFKIKIPKRNPFSTFIVTPKEGTIQKKSTQELMVSIIPGSPSHYTSSFFIQIGNFEETRVDVSIDAMFAQIVLSLPRDDNDPAHQSIMNKMRLSLQNSEINDREEISVQSSQSSVRPLLFDEKDMLEHEKKFIHQIISKKSNSPLFLSRVQKTEDSMVDSLLGKADFIAQYVLDFGELVLGETMTKKIELKSVSPFPISFDIDVSSLKRSGFRIEPNSFKEVPSLSVQQIEITFNAATRRINDIGDVSYPIIFSFPDKHRVLVTLKALLKTPFLGVSQTHFEFGQVIIGQTKIMTLQLQNMNSVSCEFSFEEAQPLDILRRSSQSVEINPYSIVPSTGILPPSSYINIAIHFAPQNEKSFQMQVPLRLRHSPDPIYITVNGSGALLQLVFKPTELLLPPIMPYSGYSSLDVTICNPSQYPVDFFSCQFDEDINNEGSEDPREAESPFVTYTPKIKAPAAASKFSLVVIVDGPPLSGKTTLSRSLSRRYNVPIINLVNLWNDKTEYSQEIRNLINTNEFSSGFIIDGLDGISDPSFDELFLQQSFKQKGLVEEISKKPFSYTQSSHKSNIIRAIEEILSVLEGHFVFHIVLNLQYEDVNSRKDKRYQRERRNKRKLAKEEKDSLFQMTEEEYEKLSKEEKEVIDSKRRELRQKFFEQPDGDQQVKHTRKKHQNSDAVNDVSQNTNSKKKSNKISQIPTDPIQIACTIFEFSIGTIINRVQNGTEKFKAIDPYEIGQLAPGVLNTIFNTLIVDASQNHDEILKQVLSFVPPIKNLKEYAFKMQIPQPVIIDGIAASDAMRVTTKIPEYFYIAVDENSIKPKKVDSDEYSKRHLTPKWHINGEKEISMTIKFEPKGQMGNIQETLVFGIEKSSAPPISLKVKSLCTLPDIDRSSKSIFSIITPKFDPKISPAFVSDINAFHFGNTIICKERNSKTPTKYRASIFFVNTSPFIVEMSPFFIDQPPKQLIWSIEPSVIIIPPQEKIETVIGFHPINGGIFKTTLGLFIKDNPEPFYINCVSECFVPSIDLSTTVLDYEKCLINTEKSRKIEMKNNGKINSAWRIKGFNAFSGILTISELEGIIGPKSSLTLVAKFASTKPISLKKGFVLEVLNEEKTQVYQTHNIQVSLESFDVNFDLIMPKAGQDTLDFGFLKVGQSKQMSIVFKNRGKYPISYKLSPLDPKFSKILSLSPFEGIVPPGDKGSSIMASFSSSSIIQMQSTPMYSLKIIDSQTKSVTENINIPVSVATSYNSYSLSVGKKVDFGLTSTGLPVSKEIILKNTGSFPFEFEIKPKSEEPNESQKIQKSLPVMNNKSKAKKAGQNSVTIGQFTFTPSLFSLTPNSQVSIVTEFLSNDPGQFTSIASLSIPDLSPQDSHSLIKFSAISYSPAIDVSSNEKVFPGLPLCIRVDLSKKDITCFLEDERIIHFAPRVLNQKETVTVQLINTQPIECHIDVFVRSKTKTPVPFEISEKSVVIAPNSTSSIQVSFLPITNESFSASFEALLHSNPNSNGLFKFGLEGIGSLPSVSLSTNLEKGKTGYICNLGKTLLGYDKTKSIALSNDKPISAIISIVAKPTPDFEISGIESSTINMQPNRQIIFNVIHRPQKPRKNQFDVSINIIENPKSNFVISFFAEGYSEDIVFEGLNEECEIHFKDTVIGRSQQVSFIAKNVSDSDIRFIMNSTPDIVFNPRVGHLRRNQSKEISAVFFSEKPVKYIASKGNCQITKIELVDINSEDWDDSKKIVTFVPIDDSVNKNLNGKVPPISEQTKGTKKVVSVLPEPSYRPIQGIKPRDIPLKVFSVSDIIKYSIDTNEIAFASTMMYQSRSVDVKLINTSSIRFEYQWELIKFESLRTDYSTTKSPPFHIEPSTGYIESGQSSIFKVFFSPMEVDDFTGKFLCQIPFLTQSDPPLIDVSGLSRRPICHFNIISSDYLTRRHPDFTYSLPDNVQVIEIFAKSVGSKSSRKVEIINPTSEPYETSWNNISDNSMQTISCDINRALVSSGKHYLYSFSFCPSSAKMVESLWEFEIPKHGIKAYFLFVGRITH